MFGLSIAKGLLDSVGLSLDPFSLIVYKKKRVELSALIFL
jgi:hypothetical protein